LKKITPIHGRFRHILAFFTLWGLFEPENENPLVKWVEKFFQNSENQSKTVELGVENKHEKNHV